MLKRIEHIKGIGLLHDANGKPYEFRKATLIYADNGRGKSTLASVLRSCATGDASSITNRATVDGVQAPDVLLQFDSGHKVSFQGQAWKETRPELLVFDADFVERNVYSGGAVSTTQRKSLLEFALGEQAVEARKRVDDATAKAKIASEAVSKITGSLSGYHVGTLLPIFEKMAQATDADEQIGLLQKRIAAAGNNANLQKLANPAVAPVPAIDLESLFGIFQTSLKDVEASAESKVREHTALHGGASAENWISEGRKFEQNDQCPYCAQSLLGNDLIKAYGTHFNQAYIGLKQKCSQLIGDVETRTADQIVEQFSSSVAIAQARADAWSENLPAEKFSFDKVAVLANLKELREKLLLLANAKALNPLDQVGTTADKASASANWQEILAAMNASNQAIQILTAGIAAFKEKLGSENVQQLKTQVLNLEIAKKRHLPEVKALFEKLTAARIEVDLAEKTKSTERENLDTRMTATLGQYQGAINKLLKNFGASFAIDGMAANFRGAGPRSEFFLKLRGKEVLLTGGVPSFATVLSEGDKRTLAFAFFIASVQADPKLQSRVVVIDDPMCSLDLNRKQQTRNVLKNIHLSAAQLIVLAHDPYFIRDLREDLVSKDGQHPMALYQLSHAANDYTDFAPFDVERECESPYFRHHRMLTEFVDGVPGLDKRAVAKVIRLMLEGYLHRRFPGLVPEDLMFGGVIQHIRDAQLPHALAHAQNIVDELNEINLYAGQFHHDTNPGHADTVVVTSSELKTFSQRSLKLVYAGTV